MSPSHTGWEASRSPDEILRNVLPFESKSQISPAHDVFVPRRMRLSSSPRNLKTTRLPSGETDGQDAIASCISPENLPGENAGWKDGDVLATPPVDEATQFVPAQLKYTSAPSAEMAGYPAAYMRDQSSAAQLFGESPIPSAKTTAVAAARLNAAPAIPALVRFFTSVLSCAAPAAGGRLHYAPLFKRLYGKPHYVFVAA